MSQAYFRGGNSSTNSNSSKFDMFRHASSRPAFNSSSGNFPLSAVRSRLWSTDGVSHRSLLTAAMHPPVNSHFPHWILAQILSSWVCLPSTSTPAWIDIWLTNLPLSNCHQAPAQFLPEFSCLIASHLSTISCPILARHSSVCCPIPAQPGHPAVCSYTSKMFCRKDNLWHVCHLPTHPFVGLLVPAPCSLVSHSTDCQHTDSRIASPKHYHLQDVSHSVSSFHLLASTAGIHRCGHDKTPRIHMFNLAPSSEWFRPKHTSPTGTTSPVPSRPLRMARLRSGPCLG